jgi:hypothetical protein
MLMQMLERLRKVLDFQITIGLAKAVTTLDVLSQGRSMLGLGAAATTASMSPSASPIRH